MPPSRRSPPSSNRKSVGQQKKPGTELPPPTRLPTPALPAGSPTQRLVPNGSTSSHDLEAAEFNVLLADDSTCDIILVHPAEGVAPVSLARGLLSALCGCTSSGTPEAADVLAKRRALHARMRSIGIGLTFNLSRDGDEILIKVQPPDQLLYAMAERLALEKPLADGSGTAPFLASAAANNGYAPVGGTRSIFTSLERVRIVAALIEYEKEEGGCGIDLEEAVASGVLSAALAVHEPAVVDSLMKTWCRAPWSLFPSPPLDEIRDYYGEAIALYFAFAGHLTSALVLPMVLGVAVLAASRFYGTMDNPACPAYSVVLLLWTTWFCKSWTREQSRLAFRWKVEMFEETERARYEFEGPLARGFYSDENYFVDISESERFASTVPLTKRFTTAERTCRVVVSYAFIIPVIVAVIAGTFSVLAFRSSLQLKLYYTEYIEIGALEIVDLDEKALWRAYAPSIGSGIGGALNATFIVLMNYVYRYLAEYLNEFENHRTKTRHYDALITKTYLFQFINSYVALFYIAYIKALHINILNLEQGEYCHDLSRYGVSSEELLAEGGGVNKNCMDELGAYLAFVLTFSRVLSIFLEWAVPAGMRKLNTFIEEANLRRALKAQLATTPDLKEMMIAAPWAVSFAQKVLRRGAPPHAADVTVLPRMTLYEEQAKLEPHDGIFSEYNSLIINLGYVVLFAPSFPIAAAICYFTFLVELKADAYKLLKNARRPCIHTCAEDIGSWLKVLWTLSTIAVFTNMSLIGFTSVQFRAWLPLDIFGWTVDESNTPTFFFLCEHTLLGCQYLVAHVLPDMPMDTSVERARAQWRSRSASIAMAGKLPRAREVWDDCTIPRRYFATLNGMPFPNGDFYQAAPSTARGADLPNKDAAPPTAPPTAPPPATAATAATAAGRAAKPGVQGAGYSAGYSVQGGGHGVQGAGATKPGGQGAGAPKPWLGGTAPITCQSELDAWLAV